MNKNHSKQKQIDALDLLIEDISTTHPFIRKEAKKLDCENELNFYAQSILEYIRTKRDDVLNNNI